MPTEFLAPGWLAALVLVPAVFFWPRRVRGLTHGLLRAAVLVLLVCALARPARLGEEGRERHVLVLDGSASLGPEAQAAGSAAVGRILQALPGDARLALVVLGADLAAGVSDDRIESRVTLAGDVGGSPLGAALGVAADLLPEGARGAVTLLSDGLATDRHHAAAVEALTERRLPVHTVDLGRPAGDLRIVGLDLEEPLRVGQTARVHATLVGPPSRVRLTLLGPAGPLASLADLAVEGRTSAALDFEPAEAGFAGLAVEAELLEGEDRRPGNERLARPAAVQDPVQLLYLGRRVQGGADQLAGLLGRGFEVRDAALDGSPPQFGEADLVVLDDRPAEDLPRAVQQRLADEVREAGLGLLVAGGPASFGPGGYHETPIAGALPVELIQKEEKKDPSTALAVIIDTSGSMGGNRIRIAKEVTRLAIRRLLPHDKVGIVEFYGNKRWAAPLQSAANAIDIQRALNRLDSGGGTVLFPAIEEAYYGLKNVQTRYKHVLMLTDAGVETGPYEALLRRMARDGICVSTVLVGPERHSKFLVQLADWGNGRFYNASNRFNLPEVMLKQPSTARLPAYRPGQWPVTRRGGLRWWGPSAPESVPALDGYVETRARPRAEVLLATAGEDHPILASWQLGLGRVTALTTEPTGPGTESWRDWAGYGPLLARAVSRTAGEGRLPFRFSLRREGHHAVLRAERLGHGRAAPTARLLDGGAGVALVFRERADGIHEAAFEAAPDRELRVEAGVLGRAAAGRFRLVSGPAADVSPELQVDPELALDLDRLARATGGSAQAAASGSFDLPAGGGERPLRLVNLQPLFALLALAVFLGELLFRRWPGRRQEALG